MTKTSLRLVATLALLLALSACQGIKKQLGLTKEPLDEFRVTSQAPLSVPPDFVLRPPEPGAVRPQDGTPQQQARSAVFKIDDPSNPSPDVTPFDELSVGEKSLLMAAGADKVDPNIRVLIDSETGRINDSNQGFVETLVFWRTPDAPGVIVDAEEEARRLNENAALGKTPTSGETPTVERRKKALFEGIF